MGSENFKSQIKVREFEKMYRDSNILGLIKRVKTEERREKINTALVVTLSLSILILIGLAITL